MNALQAIEVKNLRKEFVVKKGSLFRRKKEILPAVKGVSFNIDKGEIFSLLGPNGAGKTTIIKMLSTLLIPTRGRATVMGFDIVGDEARVREIQTAVLPGERTLYWKLTVRENLEYFGSLYGLKRHETKDRVQTLLTDFDMEEKRDVLVEKLSTGQRQKVVLARALLPRPQVILLDEPTLGLDPVSARNLRDMIRGVKAEGTTVLLTTHYMYEADELSDRVAIINQGVIAILDTPLRLKQDLPFKKLIRLECSRWDENTTALFRQAYPLQGIKYFQKNGIYVVELSLCRNHINLEDFTGFCRKQELRVHQVRIDDPSLEDVFVHHTGNKMEEEKSEGTLLA